VPRAFLWSSSIQVVVEKAACMATCVNLSQHTIESFSGSQGDKFASTWLRRTTLAALSSGACRIELDIPPLTEYNEPRNGSPGSLKKTALTGLCAMKLSGSGWKEVTASTPDAVSYRWFCRKSKGGDS
jgi:hypothetical protein